MNTSRRLIGHGAHEGPGVWADRAACRKAPRNSHFVDTHLLRKRARGVVLDVQAAKQICATCPVLAECREWALGTPDPAMDHVAGGLDPLERSRIRRRGVA